MLIVQLDAAHLFDLNAAILRQQQEIPAQQQGYQPITKDEYCINTVDRKLEK
jgi:hypothetical protein